MERYTTSKGKKMDLAQWKDIASFAYNIVYKTNSYRDDLVKSNVGTFAK